jgi:hypothetical protein
VENGNNPPLANPCHIKREHTKALNIIQFQLTSIPSPNNKQHTARKQNDFNKANCKHYFVKIIGIFIKEVNNFQNVVCPALHFLFGDRTGQPLPGYGL